MAPFAIDFERATALYGDMWAESLPLQMSREYENILIEFSKELLDETGFSMSTVVSASVARTAGNFANNFINAAVTVAFANGESAMLSFWVYETHFTLLALELLF